MRFELVLPLVCLAISFAAMGALLRLRALLPLDAPNHRSSHRSAVPRSGGLAIWIGWMAALVALRADWRWLLPAVGLALLSYLDDRRGLPVAIRLAAQIGCAMAAIVWLMPDAGAAYAFGLLMIVLWAMNLYNFMDGSDGLAASTAVCGFAMLSLAAWLGGAADFSWLLASLAASALGFLAYNWSPARVFMGDVGSIPLGFLAAMLSLVGLRETWWESWLPPLVFLPFIVDASLTLASRALRGERIWQAHREHAYQKLIRLGWSHARTASTYVALQTAGGAAALAAAKTSPRAGPWLLALWTMILLTAYAAVQWHWMRAQRLEQHAQS